MSDGDAPAGSDGDSDADGAGSDDAPPDATLRPDRDPLLLDAMLGKLATYLRMCGYDAAYALDRDVEADDALLELAASEARRLVTRDTELAERAPGGVRLESREVTDQLRELADAGLELELADPPTRCGRCNGRLERVDVRSDVPDYAPDPADEAVWRCEACGQHFWKGSHWDDVRERLAGL